MALPMNRVMEINARAIKILEEYRKELSQVIASGDFAKVGEIRTSVDLVMGIVTLANKPYVDDDLLRHLGLLDEDAPAKSPPASGCYSWDDSFKVDDDLLRHLGLLDDES